ncbi:helix-turn-helix transcriptional regulator [Streptomyces sp. NPDC001817]|uniref:helix-turn-helix domain-containing protein n=1 Tax=Streptomyces sp. NPDC001817 TaxID=3154398 RepID=UPI00332F14D0
MGIFARDESRTTSAASRIARQATASLAGVLAGQGKTRSDLAAAMGVSPGRVSQIMSGDANLTVRTLAAVAEALDADVQITFCPRGQSTDTKARRSTGSSPIQSSGHPAHH